jgi:hypothetical protein
VTQEKNGKDIAYLEGLMARQQERLKDRPDVETLAEKMDRVRDAGMKADEERRMAAKAAAEEAMAGDDKISPWYPEADPHIRAAVGKLAEELNETAKVCARIAIQGLDGIDPDSGRTNREELYRELSHVMGATDIVETFAPPSPETVAMMSEQRQKKRNGFLKWHKMISDHFKELYKAAGLGQL